MPEDLRAVFDSLKTSAEYAKGAVVFRETDPCNNVFVVCEGSLKLVTGSREGKVLLLRSAGPGQVLGVAEAVLGEGAPYECSAIAVGPSVVAVIPRDTFMRFVLSYPEACFRMTVALSEQYRWAQQEARFLAFGATSTARLTHLLLDWSADRGEVPADGVHIPSPFTQTELAQSIGTTRETVTRILGDLDRRGILERRPNEIVIRKAEEMIRLADY